MQNVVYTYNNVDNKRLAHEEGTKVVHTFYYARMVIVVVFYRSTLKQWSGNSIVGRRFVRPSVCPSVTLMDADHIR